MFPKSVINEKKNCLFDSRHCQKQMKYLLVLHDSQNCID
jgi:hypothetical protein